MTIQIVNVDEPITKISNRVNPNINENISNIFGHIIGDGGLYKNKIFYNNTNIDLINDFIDNFKKSFNYDGKIFVSNYKGAYRLIIYDKLIWLFLIGILLDGKYQKTVSKLKLVNRANKKAFLKAMFDDDGSISKKGIISIVNKDSSIILFIKNQLMNIGFDNIVRYTLFNKKYNKNYHALRISKQYNEKFLRLISFKHKKKLNRLQNNIIKKQR